MKSSSKDVIVILDSALEQTYKRVNDEQSQTNLLGLKNSKHRFKLFQLCEPIFTPRQLQWKRYEQHGLPDCTYMCVIRSIVRLYPHFPQTIIKEVDEKWYEVKLFRPGELKQDTYRFQKTTVQPASRMLRAFNLFIRDHQQAHWIKLLEKALILRMFSIDYPPFLVNLQKESKTKSLSYYEVSELAGYDMLYQTLLGCEVQNLSKQACLNMDLTLKNLIRAGELMHTSFVKNNVHLETKHSYEVVDVLSNQQGDNVLLSNPHGINKVFGVLKNKKLKAYASVRGLSFDSLKDDKSLVIVPMEAFIKYSQELVTTINFKKRITDIARDVMTTETLDHPHRHYRCLT